MAATVPMKFMIDEQLAEAIRIAAAQRGGKGQMSAIANLAISEYLRKESSHGGSSRVRTQEPEG